MTERADGTYESLGDIRTPGELRQLYVDSIAAASDEEDKWRKKAAETWKVYTGEQGGAFNILHSNTETIVPAVFNSLPVPDIRTRFNDRDEVARRGAQILERGLSYELDEYDAQEIAEKAVRDFVVAGRGHARVVYDPLLDTRPVMQPKLDEFKQPVRDEDGNPVEEPKLDKKTNEPVMEEYLAWEKVKCEFVPFDRYRRGPGTCREQVPWEAFQKFFTKDELFQLVQKDEKLQKLPPEERMRVAAAIVNEVSLDCSTNGKAEEKDNKATREKEVFRCASVWEVWDKDRRQVAYVTESYEPAPLCVISDPLGLVDFFTSPRPLQVLYEPGTMVPLVPFSIYEKQAKELDNISARILALISMAKFRGIRAAELAELDSLENLDDGQFLSSEDAMPILQAGGLDKSIWVMPLGELITVIQTLIDQRERIKATIFELMGIADIMRGASAATETLGAQKLKAQWGSLKIQIWQNEVQRFWRDLFRIKAEIMAEHFQPDTLLAISGENEPPVAPRPEAPAFLNASELQARQLQQQYEQQLQQHEQSVKANKEWKQLMSQVFELLKSDIHRRYLIDIETDSTIQADRTRDQDAWNDFLTASAQFAQIFGPMVQQQMIPAELPIALYQSYSSRFKVGKQVEDLLAKFSEMAGPLAQQQQQSQMQAKQQENEQRELQKHAVTLDLQKKEQDVEKQALENVGQQIENRNAAMGVPSGPGIVM